MEVLHDNEELVFLYQLIEGSTDMSYACHIAALAGLPPEVVQRGKQVNSYKSSFLIRWLVLGNSVSVWHSDKSEENIIMSEQIKTLPDKISEENILYITSCNTCFR